MTIWVVAGDIFPVFPAFLLAGIHFLELKDKSWIPEQVREDREGEGEGEGDNLRSGN